MRCTIQGAQLALDRGGLQSEITGLRKELTERSEQLQSVTDSSRIKEHQLNGLYLSKVLKQV